MAVQFLPILTKIGSGLLKSGGGGGEGGGGGGQGPLGAVQMGVGGLQALAGHIKQKKADAMMPAMEDPRMLRLQRQFGRMRRGYQTGTAMNAQKGALSEMMRSGTANAFRAGGGMRGVNQMARMFQQGMVGLSGQAMQGEAQAAGQEADITNRMSQRQLELGLLKYNTEQARAARMKTGGNRNLNAGFMRAIGIGNPSDMNYKGGKVSAGGADNAGGVFSGGDKSAQGI
jgi:hypothetical protein